MARCRMAFGVLVASVTLISACGGADDASQFTVGSTPPPAVAGIPTDASRIDDAVRQLPQLAQALLDRSGIPGLSIAVVRDGSTAYSGGFGVKDTRHPDAKVDAGTVFQIASLSKAVSATVVAAQSGRNGVEWAMPVAPRVNGFALADPYVSTHVTVADMFSHRSGLPDHAGDNLEDVGFGREEILRRLRYLPLAPFRTEELYTNFGVTSAAQAVANAAGKDWETLCAETLFGPLGMTSTSARYADYERRSDRAVLHVKVGGQYEPKYQRNADAQAPAGGVSSSAVDLANWMTAVLAGGKYQGRQVIPADALLTAMTPQLALASAQTDFRPSATGFGFNISTDPSGRTVLGHSGAFASGAATNFQLIPSLNLGIVVLTNGAPVGVAESLAKEFTDLAQYGRVTADWLPKFAQIMPSTAPEGELVGKPAPAAPRPAREVGAYVGTYANDYFGPLTISATGDALTLGVGPSGQRYELTHHDGDTFTFVPRGENANAGSVSAVKFAMRGEHATSAWVEVFDADHQGTFAGSSK